MATNTVSPENAKKKRPLIAYTLEQLRSMWDDVLVVNGVTYEQVHAELTERGDKAYCAFDRLKPLIGQK